MNYKSKILSTLLALLTPSLVIAQCYVEVPCTPTPTPTAVPTARVIRFTESDAIFGNPEVGFQTTRKTKAQVSNPRNVPLLHATFRTCMSSLNPSPGIFNWSEFDSFLTAANAQGQTVQLGVIAYDPYDCSNWLKSALPGSQVYCSTENPTRTYFAPDWNQASVQGAHRAFIQAMAARYNNDPRVDSVDLRSIGDYGEWHHSCIKVRATNQPLPMPSEAARRAIIKDYHDFYSKPLTHIVDDLISRQEAVSRGAGWRADCWGGHHEDTLYPGWLSNPAGMSSLWQRARVDLEPCGALTLTSYMSLSRKIDEAIEKHVSVINTKNGIAFNDAQWPEWQRLLRKMGYRFVLREARIGSGTVVRLENVGIAPNYRPITLRFGNQSVVLDKIMPGQLVERSFSARAGTLTATYSDGRPVRFANVEWNNGVGIS